ncbi:hypothetical protein BH11BAC3_BH11BAC3_15230 [soil metagenome]
MNLKFIIATAIIFAVGISNTEAQTTRHARIRQGVRSGELTRAETANLAHGQREIRKDVRAAKADGVVTRKERKHIRKEKRQESRKIFRKKHNKRDRG